MARLIDKDASLAEIERLKKEEGWCQVGKDTADVYYARGFRFACERIKDTLDTLEVKEVDLKEEVDKIWKPRFSLGWDDKSLLSVSYKGFEVIAKHFFELGLKAKNWEKERMEECPYRQVGCTMYEGKILECRGACSWVVDYPKLKELKAQKG